MVVFDVRVNGERRFLGDQVTAITLVSDLVGKRRVDRVSMHIGTGGPGERKTHHLAADLTTGDEISIRILEDHEWEESTYSAPDGCNYCGSSIHSVKSLVAVGQVAICESCLASFNAVVIHAAPLPEGVSIRETPGDTTCGFCGKAPPDVPALLARNDAAICPGCLRSCVDIHETGEDY